MAKKRFCNYCLGAARANAGSPSHPVLPAHARPRAHVRAFMHGGRTCPHLKLHKEIWKLSSHKFYSEYTTLLQEAGFGPGALLSISHLLPSQVYKPWDRMAVVTGVDFQNDALYGLDNGYNYMLKIMEEKGDYLFNWPHGMSLYLHDVLRNNPRINHNREIQPQIQKLAKEKLTSLNFNHQVTKGSFSFDCWNDPPAWHLRYDLLKRSTFVINVLQPATLRVPIAMNNIDYAGIVSSIRKEGSYRSKNIRYFWSQHLDD
jgi:hypothetical protein